MLPKLRGGKAFHEPSAYKPICSLNTIDKVFERILKTRIENYLELTNDINEKQYGFRRGRWTVDAVLKVMGKINKASTGPLHSRELAVVVALNVTNAFNSARWNRILASM